MEPPRAALEWARSVLGKPQLGASLAWSADAATTYQLHEKGSAFAYLKLGAGLAAEHDRLLWLGQNAAAPAVLGFARDQGDEGGGDRLLTAALRGSDLSSPEHTSQPLRTVSLLAAALRTLHALDAASCPFARPEAGDAVVHGDACLPNIVCDGAELSGYLDVGELGRGNPEVDLAAAVWSLDHNLGPAFGGAFLRAYGWPAHDDATVERLRRSWERG